jgi:hypothetical protein
MVPAVLIRKSTQEIIKQDLYPREDMQPVQGMDPDYEWLVKFIPFEEPVYDSRIFIMQTNLPDLSFLDQFQQHPSYPGLREYRITYNPIKRSNAEIIMAIENAEKDANASIWSEAVHKDETMFMMLASLKKSENISITADEQAHIDEMYSITSKLAKNRDTKNIKVGQVNSGQEPNIDEGWERN